MSIISYFRNCPFSTEYLIDLRLKSKLCPKTLARSKYTFELPKLKAAIAKSGDADIACEDGVKRELCKCIEEIAMIFGILLHVSRIE